MDVEISQDATTEGVVLQVEKDTIDLIHHAFAVLMLDAHLVAIGFTNGTSFVGPFVPDVAFQVVDVIGLLLPDPENLVHGGLDGGASQGESWKFLGEVIAVDDAELFDSISGRAVFPVRANFFALSVGAVLQNVLAHVNENLVCFTHDRVPLSNFRAEQLAIKVHPLRNRA